MSELKDAYFTDFDMDLYYPYCANEKINFRDYASIYNDPIRALHSDELVYVCDDNTILNDRDWVEWRRVIAGDNGNKLDLNNEIGSYRSGYCEVRALQDATGNSSHVVLIDKRKPELSTGEDIRDVIYITYVVNIDNGYLDLRLDHSNDPENVIKHINRGDCVFSRGDTYFDGETWWIEVIYKDTETGKFSKGYVDAKYLSERHMEPYVHQIREEKEGWVKE